MIEINIIREEKSQVKGGSRFLVQDSNGNYYVVSSIPAAPDTGKPETLVFPSNSNGEVVNYIDIAGGINLSVDGAIKMLREVLNGERTYTIEDNPMMQNANGNPLIAILNSLNVIANPPGPDYYEDEEEA
jgi:hypothetical protein